MKTVLFVPGFQEDIHFRDYASVMAAVRARGYKVTFVPINWRRTTITQWVDELNAAYRDYDHTQTILAGFSYGAMTALVVAAQKNPSELWLFSLSPYFAEDIKSRNMKASWLQQIGKHRRTTFSQLNFTTLAKAITCKTLLFVGQTEAAKWKVMEERAIEANRLLKNSSLVTVKGVGHDVADQHYVNEIVRMVK